MARASSMVSGPICVLTDEPTQTASSALRKSWNKTLGPCRRCSQRKLVEKEVEFTMIK